MIVIVCSIIFKVMKILILFYSMYVSVLHNNDNELCNVILKKMAKKTYDVIHIAGA